MSAGERTLGVEATIGALPRYRRSFVGRRAYLERVARALEPGALVTLHGPAGMGKTRLSVEAAARLARDEGIPAVFCDLSTAHSAEDILGEVVRALALSVRATLSSDDLSAQIGSLLARRGRLVLILDNFEQITEFAASTVGAWRGVAREVSFLATSRHLLDLPGEEAIRIHPLDVPAERARDAPSFAAYEAMQLFASRVPHYAVGADDVEDRPGVVADIVRVLDGLPLAIELAAARLEILSLDTLAERLQSRFQVLRHPSAREDERHGTLWSAIDWSWDLLAPWEQRGLLQCSVFAGSFDLEAAEAVIDVDGGHNTLDLLQVLVRKSLVRMVGSRFTLMESIRAYAAGKLDDLGQRTEVEERHARYYLEHGVHWSRLANDQGGEPMLRLQAEEANLYAILRRALGRGEAGARDALTSGRILAPILHRHTSRARHLVLLDEIIALATASSATATDPLTALLLCDRAFARLWHREPREACLEDLERGLAIAREAGDLKVTGVILGRIGSLGTFGSREEEEPSPRAYYQRALVLAEEIGDLHLQSVSHASIALDCDMAEGRLAEAEAGCRRAIDLAARAGNRVTEAQCTGYLGHLLMEALRLEEAREHLTAARHLHVASNQGTFVYDMVGALGIVHFLQGELDDARTAFELTIDEALAYADPRFPPMYRCFLGVLDASVGRLGEAEAQLERSISGLQATVDLDTKALGLSTLAALRAHRGDHAGAEAAQAEAATLVATLADPHARDILGVGAGALELHAARQALRDCERQRSVAHIAVAERTAASLSSSPSRAARMAAPVLAHLLALAEPAASGWLVAADGAWFAPPGEERVALVRRPQLAAILAAFATTHCSDPGAALGVEALTAAGWPGERIIPKAARNRVYVALSTLRKLGMGLIERADGGWRLDPEAPVAVVPGEKPS